MTKPPLFPKSFLIYSSFTQVWWWWVHQSIKWKWENKKPFNMLCVFLKNYFVVSCEFNVCLFSLKLCQQVQGVLCDCKCFVLHLCYHHPHAFAIHPPSQNITTLIHPPHHFFVTTIVESSTPNIFISMKAKCNGLYFSVDKM